ncbi:MAG TPA: NAD(P)-dependent oxidoreductase [Dermatophilaceae bacterium]|nr:NAD(P)-dependent oxidoreductase [Dermatophilaceae bacterium]
MTGSLRVAVVGTGRMGAAMVGRLAGAGHAVSVYNRTRDKAEAVASQHHAAVAPTAREAVRDVDVVVVSLADDAAVRSAYLGPHGLVAGLASGQVVAETSTVDPETVRELAGAVAARGAQLIDTPVSGSVSTVEAGGLLVMAGGDVQALDRARPVLEAFATRIVHLGDLGAGATMKLVVNAMVHALNAALSEALVLAERAGIDREAAYDVIASSAVAAPFVAYKRESFLHPEQAPVAFALDLVAKDLALADALARRLGAPMPLLAANREVVRAAVEAGLGSADLSALAILHREGLG